MSSVNRPDCATTADATLWDRREVVMGGVTGGLAMTIGAASTLTAAARCLFVADSRIPASRDFAASGERVAWIEGDVTRLWYEDLDIRWRYEKIAIAGLTLYGAFFCLQRLAMDRGLRAVFKGEHRRSGSRLSHALSGPEDVVTNEALAALSHGGWPVRMAHLAVASRVSGRMTSQARVTTSARGDEPPLLVSWMISPTRRAGDRG